MKNEIVCISTHEKDILFLFYILHEIEKKLLYEIKRD